MPAASSHEGRPEAQRTQLLSESGYHAPKAASAYRPQSLPFALDRRLCTCPPCRQLHRAFAAGTPLANADINRVSSFIGGSRGSRTDAKPRQPHLPVATCLPLSRIGKIIRLEVSLVACSFNPMHPLARLFDKKTKDRWASQFREYGSLQNPRLIKCNSLHR